MNVVHPHIYKMCSPPPSVHWLGFSVIHVSCLNLTFACGKILFTLHVFCIIVCLLYIEFSIIQISSLDMTANLFQYFYRHWFDSWHITLVLTETKIHCKKQCSTIKLYSYCHKCVFFQLTFKIFYNPQSKGKVQYKYSSSCHTPS